MTDRVFSVAFGFPGSIDHHVVGVFDTQEEAAEAAVREVEMYLDTFDGSTIDMEGADHADWWMTAGGRSWTWLVFILSEMGMRIGYVWMSGINKDSPEVEHLRWAADYEAGINTQEAN